MIALSLGLFLFFGLGILVEALAICWVWWKTRDGQWIV